MSSYFSNDSRRLLALVLGAPPNPWVRTAGWLSPNTWSTRVQWLPFVLRVVRRTASSSHSVLYSYMAGIALASAALAFVSLLAAINFARSVPPHDLADSSPITKGFPVGGTALPDDPREHTKVYSYYRGRCRTLQYRIVLICGKKGPDFGSSDTTKPRYCPTRARDCLTEYEPT